MRIERNIGIGPHCTTTVGGDLVYFIACVEKVVNDALAIYYNDSQVTK